MSQEEFVSVTNGEVWNPTKDENKQPATADENSCIVGTFMGFEENQGKDNNTNLYRIMAESIGNVELEEPKMMSFWGSHVLDDNILNKARLQEGMRFKVLWKGMKQPKKPGGRAYNDYEVFVPKTQAMPNAPVAPTAPLAANPVATPASVAKATVAPAKVSNAASPQLSVDDSDELPF